MSRNHIAARAGRFFSFVLFLLAQAAMTAVAQPSAPPAEYEGFIRFRNPDGTTVL